MMCWRHIVFGRRAGGQATGVGMAIASLYLLLLASSCVSHRASWSANQKYAPAVLQKDYGIYREVLEKVHPGLYWYTPKDSMDRYFDWGRAQLKDSLTEQSFRRVLAYVTSKIRCGHTSVRPSARYSNYLDTVRVVRIFPLSLKLWNDTAVVAANLFRRDSILSRGTRITAIDGRSIKSIIDTLFQFIPTDGYNTTHKYQALSNRGYFGSLYTNVFGFGRSWKVDYVDSTGKAGSRRLIPYYPVLDTANRRSALPRPRIPKPSRKERRDLRRNAVRLLKIDTANHTAMMDLNSFSKGYRLRSFFRRSFRTLKQRDIRYLIIDVRGNGGGSVTNSTLLTKYLSDHRFKVGDSLYAITRRKPYTRLIEDEIWNRMFMVFFARKRRDGLYHFRYFEKKQFKPRNRNHFDGQTYVLTGGNSFSATTLFASALRGQDNVTLVGEETGGGAYGNNAWLIPDVTLPGTGVGFRLPLFRLVIDARSPKTGLGVQPEVFSGPTIQDVRDGKDYKLDRAMELIEARKKQNR